MRGGREKFLGIYVTKLLAVPPLQVYNESKLAFGRRTGVPAFARALCDITANHQALLRACFLGRSCFA